MPVKAHALLEEDVRALTLRLALPGLLAMAGIYPALDKSFDIENRIHALREQQLNGEEP